MDGGWRDATGARWWWCAYICIYMHFLFSIHHYGKYLNIIKYSVYFASGVCISCNWCRISSSEFCTSLNGTPDLSQPAKWQVLKSIETVQLLPGVAAETGSGCIVDTRNYMFAFKLNPKTGPTNRVKIHQAKTAHVDAHSVLLVCLGLTTKVAPGSLSDRDERKVAQ